MTWRERFSPVHNGVFLMRKGPGIETIYRDHKVCFFCCDQDVLGSCLDTLSERPDCAAVKLSAGDRGGMYLGRAFFDSPEAVGEVWAYYKLHPHLFCSVQDDVFTAPWRSQVRSWSDRH